MTSFCSLGTVSHHSSVFPPAVFVQTRSLHTWISWMPSPTKSSEIEESLRCQLEFLIRAKDFHARGVNDIDSWNRRIRRVQLRLQTAHCKAENHRVDRDDAAKLGQFPDFLPPLTVVLQSMSSTEHPWTPSQDKAIKIDVVIAHGAGNAITAAMREWLQHYNAPQNSLPDRPPHYFQQRLADLYARLHEKQARKNQVDTVASHPPPPPIRAHKHYERKRVALYTRLAHKKALQVKIAKLDALRKRTVAASVRQWPPSRSNPLHPDNLALEATRRMEERQRAAEEEARQAAEVIRRRAEAEARVAHLIELREAGRFRLGKRFL
ncbi:hypothetical protein R3P38DRAFT_2791947 [Favolaschia claudopus]|uniref:Uncharacterized protein n=1 Tax=Favolaschia claudopus TaxID=2862362 RepID=A0AAW0AG22_9AGAR